MKIFSSSLPLSGKVALVTGASRGIGRAIAIRLAKDGALVAVHYSSNADAAAQVIDEIEANGGMAFTVQAQLGSIAAVDSLYAALDTALEQRTQDTQFDILVNNAAIAPRATLEETSEELFDEVIAVNVKAPFFLIQRAGLRLRDNGRIINISSAVTRVAQPDTIAYDLTKGAINALTYTLAKHLGPRGIAVNALLPGIIETDMNANWLHTDEMQKFAANISAMNRVGQPEDIADAVAFLASDDSRWITAQLIDASGGTQL